MHITIQEDGEYKLHWESVFLSISYIVYSKKHKVYIKYFKLTAYCITTYLFNIKIKTCLAQYPSVIVTNIQQIILKLFLQDKYYLSFRIFIHSIKHLLFTHSSPF